MGNHHAVDASRGSCRRGIQIRVTIQVNHADVAKITAYAGNRGQRNGTISAQNYGKRGRFYSLLYARLQRLHCGKYSRKISRARTFFVRFEIAGRVVAKVREG